MPSVVYLKYLRITGEGVDSQGKFYYATCDEVELPVYPHCGSHALIQITLDESICVAHRLNTKLTFALQPTLFFI